MRRFVITAFAACLIHFSFAQKDSNVVTQYAKKSNERMSNDHLMLQLGHTIWLGKPDSVNTKGWTRSFAGYIMMDFPFKTNTHWSVGLGPGISAENQFFDRMVVDIKSTANSVPFIDAQDTTHFKKFKMTTAFLELPIELRYSFKPYDDRNSIKFALGVKVGTLVGVHTKGKTLQDKNENAINDYIVKENTKRFLNRNRLSVMARLGFGHFTAFGTYAITPLFKEGNGPDINPLTVGLPLSGL
jgi:Outer membrane protein beta-barrel domain